MDFTGGVLFKNRSMRHHCLPVGEDKFRINFKQIANIVIF